MSIYSKSHGLKVFEDHNTSLYKLAQLLSPTSAYVLDVGCSSGYLGQYIKLHSKGKIIVDGIEINKHDLELAKKQLDNVYDIDIQSSSQHNRLSRQYDTIIFADVLEHTINPKKTLGNFVTKLLPQGQVLLSVPNITHQSIILELLSGQWNYEKSGLLDKTHLHFFDFNEIIRLVEDNGLFISKIDYSIFDLPEQKISKILKKTGIKNTSEIVSLLKNPQHKIFQFIISATNRKPNYYRSYIDNRQTIRPVSDWINEWEIIWNNYSNSDTSKLIHSLKINQHKNQVLEKKNSILKNKVNLLTSQLEIITSSKFFRLYPIYEKLKTVVKSVTNQK